MSEPELYQRYDRREAIALFGDEAKAQNLCEGEWLIFPELVICLANFGEAPRRSHFSNGSHFIWVADKPCIIPPLVIGPSAKGRLIRLFVCPQNSENYLYLGELDPSYMQHYGSAENYGMARFELRPTLPSAVWNQLGGLWTGGTDDASVDRALDRLRRPTTVLDRLQILQSVVEYWNPPILPEDGFSATEIGSLIMPHPLKWWYGWAGRRKRIMSGQNFLLEPEEVRAKDGRLLFYVENQGVYQWATLAEGDDPPVFGRYDDTDPWEPEGMTLSEHLILACIFEAVMCHCPYGATTSWLKEERVNEIARIIPPLPIKAWRWCESTRFYAGKGAFMFSMADRESKGGTVCIGAKTEHPLQFLKPYLDDSWEYTAV